MAPGFPILRNLDSYNHHAEGLRKFFVQHQGQAGFLHREWCVFFGKRKCGAFSQEHSNLIQKKLVNTEITDQLIIGF
jgi:hypothetical protein